MQWNLNLRSVIDIQMNKCFNSPNFLNTRAITHEPPSWQKDMRRPAAPDYGKFQLQTAMMKSTKQADKEPVNIITLEFSSFFFF